MTNGGRERGRLVRRGSSVASAMSRRGPTDRSGSSATTPTVGATRSRATITSTRCGSCRSRRASGGPRPSARSGRTPSSRCTSTPGGRFAFDRATTRAGLCDHRTQRISVSRHFAAALRRRRDPSGAAARGRARARRARRPGTARSWKAVATDLGYEGKRLRRHPDLERARALDRRVPERSPGLPLPPTEQDDLVRPLLAALRPGLQPCAGPKRVTQ